MPDQKGEEEVDYVNLASMEVDVDAMEEVTMETQMQNPLIDKDYVEAMKILDENTDISQFTQFFTSHFSHLKMSSSDNWSSFLTMPTAILAQMPAPQSYARVISFSQAKVMTLKAPNSNTLDNSNLDDGPAPSISGTTPIPLAEFASKRLFPPWSQHSAVPSPLFDSSDQSNLMPDPNLSKLRWGPLPIFLGNSIGF